MSTIRRVVGAVFNAVGPFTSRIPTCDADHVKATTTTSVYYPYHSCRNNNSLTGGYGSGGAQQWLSSANANQAFHVDFTTAKIIRRLKYDNGHDAGSNPEIGCKAFTIWGSNNAAAFAELTYATDTYWEQLPVASNVFEQHIAADQVDTKYIVIYNNTLYRYYRIKVATGWGSTGIIGWRRIEFQELS